MTRPASVSRVLTIPAEQAFALVTDVHNHARWIPMTRIDGPEHLEVGDSFVGVSGPGARRGLPALADEMVLEALLPPVTRAGPGRTSTTGSAVYRKLGPLLLGTAEVHVRPLGPQHCQVTWVEDVHLRLLPRALTRPLLRPVMTAMLHLVLGRVSRETR
ncbi:SRPBCC family protein [Actinotalea sp. K2]|uniref:SRPBCC family protein n=1 Tax=Actinotalea sp. K2 TaxID=2939438 RepID=UPI00201780B0|nr:SRPBCC family protein [Actinotalea sp. K2]MCL3861548.1 SRPBCC family protein [Actinotalea sp. K2]